MAAHFCLVLLAWYGRRSMDKVGSGDVMAAIVADTAQVVRTSIAGEGGKALELLTFTKIAMHLVKVRDGMRRAAWRCGA